MALLAPAYDLFLPAGYKPPHERRTVVIERGQSLHDIAHELQRVGIIRSQAGFLVLARMMRLDRSVKAGQYSFRLGVTVPALLRALDRGMYGLNLVTIPEGLMVSETAALIEREVGIPAASLESLAKDPVLLDSLEVGAPSLEGWLAPDSYEWLPGTSPDVVLRTMVARTRDRVQRATAGYDSLPLGMNAHEVLTLASIVESESHAKEERPHIARVYLNRLDRGMLLQADPTVGYALGRGPRSRLTFKDLRVASPYNTYRHEGLPPGPICSPGLAAIEAVMNATVGAKDLYFVARGQGHHLFAPTYEAHLANIAFVRGKQAALAARNNPDAASEAGPDSGGGSDAVSPVPLAANPKPVAGTAGKGSRLLSHGIIKDAANMPAPVALVPAPAPRSVPADSVRTALHGSSEVAKPGAAPVHAAVDTLKQHTSKPAAAESAPKPSSLTSTGKPPVRDTTSYRAISLKSPARSAVRDSSARKASSLPGTARPAVRDSSARKASSLLGTARPAVRDSSAHKASSLQGTARPTVRDSSAHKTLTLPSTARSTARDTTHKAIAKPKPAHKPATSGVKPPGTKAPADSAKAGKGQ